MRSKTRVYPLAPLLLVALLLIPFQGCGQDNHELEAQQGAPGVPAMPPIATANKEEVEQLLADTRGKVTVVNLWATWCVPCVAELPYFTAFYEDRDPETEAFLSLSLDDPALVDTDLRRFQAQHELPFPFYVLDGLHVSDISEALGAQVRGALPETIVYDAAGNVRQHWREPISLDQLMEEVRAAHGDGRVALVNP